jgi:hypothetical protein
MKQKEIIVLYSDGKAKRVSEEKLSKKDIDSIDYMMIDTSVSKDEVSRNFVLIEPSPLLFEFTRAKVVYQLSGTSLQCSDIMENQPINPVYTEVYSITDLICLFNCIHRLHLIDELIASDESYGEYTYIELTYFEVTLYKGNRVIYNKHYFLDRDPSEHYISSDIVENVVKKFKDIYRYSPVKKLLKNHQYLFFTDDNKWTADYMVEDYDMIGIPLSESTTITLLTERELAKISKYYHGLFTYTIHENRSNKFNIGEYFLKGEYGIVEEMSDAFEYFIISYLPISFTRSYQYFLIEVLSHISFCISMTNLIWREMFPNKDKSYNANIDSIIEITLTNQKEQRKTVYMNEDSIISLYDFLQIL